MLSSHRKLCSNEISEASAGQVLLKFPGPLPVGSLLPPRSWGRGGRRAASLQPAVQPGLAIITSRVAGSPRVRLKGRGHMCQSQSKHSWHSLLQLRGGWINYRGKRKWL